MSRVDRYRACAERGMSIGATARLYGVSRTAVAWANKRHNLGFGVRPNDTGRDLVACRERMTNLAAQGDTCREISVKMGVPFNTALRWSRVWEIKLGQWPGGKKRVIDVLAPHLNDAEMRDMKFLKTKGYTFRDALRALKRPDLLEFLPRRAA